MLKLVDVKKEYYAGGETVHALKGVSINFHSRRVGLRQNYSAEHYRRT